MKATRNRAKNRLTNAAKRVTITLGTVMIRIQHKDHVIECSNAAEAIEMLKYIDSVEQPATPDGSILSVIQAVVAGSKSAWSRKSFLEFVESLGDAQTRVLTLLVKGRMTDQDLRKALKLEGNQALAGVLSGISKQAGALNVPARAVYTVEDERKGGEVTKTYAIALDFLRMARDMNWTGD